MINCPDSSVSHAVRCSICREAIGEHDSLYQARLSLGVYCSKCKEKFTQEEIESIIPLLIGRGGYFGQHPRNEFPLEKLIISATQVLSKGGSLEEFLYYHALIYGITPRELPQVLQGYFKKL